jgi:hypothetical protein
MLAVAPVASLCRVAVNATPGVRRPSVGGGGEKEEQAR